MPDPRSSLVLAPVQSDWLRTYYFTRAGVSIAWIAAVFAVGVGNPAIAGLLLVLYPAWDALANYVDARRAGGLAANPSQALNVVVSAVTTAVVLAAATTHLLPVLYVFGVWAGLAGLFQLVTALRRWSAGAQWAMVLSGAQSVLAGGFFFLKAGPTLEAAAAAVAPYAGFGAFYFLVSATWLVFRRPVGRVRPA